MVYPGHNQAKTTVKNKKKTKKNYDAGDGPLVKSLRNSLNLM